MNSVLRLGVEAGGDPVGHHVVRVGDDLGRVGVVARQRVPVGDEVEAVVLVLQRGPVVERPTRWPRCSFPVGRMPETTRGFIQNADCRKLDC